ncbi:tyrosine-type recombinase/integrase [Salipiger thiooxidans]|uniref:tyrosine-type recombinase/integrase n=1 Tax=Salipiger thiooxidans TaxID=282683 RepID=UPI001CD4325A|nr:tyrosine-type recombinase/integrase [Salipiger thiooxidans]MCA0849211.1 tyrosine-type recombinase/integrase [Salipiger thiooxidans]
MSAKIMYAYKHRQTWLYRRNYPKHLQPVLGQALKQSLRTGDARIAKARVTEANGTYDRIVAEAEQKLTTKEGSRSLSVGTTPFRRIRLAGQTLIKDLAGEYLDQRSRQLRPGTFKAVRFSIGLFASAYGSRMVADLDRQDGAEFLRQIQRLCPNVAKSASAKGLGLVALVKLSASSPTRIGAQTQKRIWKQVCHFLDWTVTTGNAEHNELGVLSVEAKPEVQSYSVLTDDEVSALLRAEEPILRPMFRLCLLSGLRSGEACGLMADDFVTKGNLGTFIRVRPNQLRQLKSKAAEREVPLHDRLLPMLNRLPSEGALFRSINADRVTKRFTRLRAKLALDRPGVVFHSTRKWFITQCERTGVPEHFTASLVGHQSARSENKLTYGLYSAGISDEQKRRIIDQIQLPGGCSQ